MSKTEWHRIVSSYQLQQGFMEENSVRTIEAGGKKLCLVKTSDEYFVMDDKCPHAGGSLGQGWCDEKGNVICPFHRYRFNPRTGSLAAGKGYYVNTYPLELRDGALYVGITKKGWFW